MIDFNAIGSRIKEERKYILKISQEKMAEDLFMYQADISNIEKAKSGSGIADLAKLDMIADYFNIPLETLLFGREDKNVKKYHGSQMQIKESKKKPGKTQYSTLHKLLKVDEAQELIVVSYECGPYQIFVIPEYLRSMGGSSNADENGSADPEPSICRLHVVTFIGTEVVGVLSAYITSVMQYVHEPSMRQLQNYIMPDIMNIRESYRVLNPFCELYLLTEDEEIKIRMFERMTQLRESGERRRILYVESVYVREDCRRNGIFRMLIDLLRLMFEGCAIWLNLEPTAGAELHEGAGHIPSYTVAELGQMNMNASIAERVGFTVDSLNVTRNAEKADENGNISVESVTVRKYAYSLPAELRKIISEDGDLVEQGRALRKIEESETGLYSDGVMDINHGFIDDELVVELRVYSDESGYMHNNAILGENGVHYVVSKSSLLRDKTNAIEAEYYSLEEAKGSKYYDHLVAANWFLEMMGESFLMSNPGVENFDVLDDCSYNFADGSEMLEVKLKRTNTDDKGEILYAYVYKDTDGSYEYGLNKEALYNIQEKALSSEEFEEYMTENCVASYTEEDMLDCKYANIFQVIKEHM